MEEKSWLDKLCEPLEHPQYPQIVGHLFKLNADNDIIGKCAQGEIACQNNLIDWKTYQFNTLGSSEFKKLGLPEDLLWGNLPDISLTRTENETIVDFDSAFGASLGQIIIHLNDKGFTYPQIVEFLRTTFEDAV